MGLIYQLHGGRQHGSAEKWPAMVAGQAAEQHSHPDLSGAPITLLKNKKQTKKTCYSTSVQICMFISEIISKTYIFC